MNLSFLHEAATPEGLMISLPRRYYSPSLSRHEPPAETYIMPDAICQEMPRRCRETSLFMAMTDDYR